MHFSQPVCNQLSAMFSVFSGGGVSAEKGLIAHSPIKVGDLILVVRNNAAVMGYTRIWDNKTR